jgi:hypothetical protein
MNKNKTRKTDMIQSLTRTYLRKLSSMANKHGLSAWLNNIIKENKKGECSATQRECELLARACNDERINRIDIPKLLGKSYRECNDSGDFDKIKKLKHVGTYSKISAIIYNVNHHKKGKIGKKDRYANLGFNEMSRVLLDRCRKEK